MNNAFSGMSWESICLISREYNNKRPCSIKWGNENIVGLAKAYKTSFMLPIFFLFFSFMKIELPL